MRKLAVATVAMGLVGMMAQADTVDWEWGGFYAGFHGGYGFGDQSVELGGSSLINLGQELEVLPKKLDTDPDGGLGGIQLGVNRQDGNFVFGLEVDFSLSDISGSDKAVLNQFGSDVVTSTTQELEWFATARLRAGVSVGRILLYGTGGVALGRSEFSGRIDDQATGLLFDDSMTETSVGWVGGAGLAIALTESFSLFGEFLYYDLGSETLTMDGLEDTFAEGERATMDYDVNGFVGRVGANFHF